MSASQQTLLRSQSGAGAGVPLSVAPGSALRRIDSHLFRVLLLRRLHLRLHHSSVRCRCGRPFDPFGHHRIACARTGELGRRAFAVESAGARVCREAGGRVAVNVMVRDMDIAAPDPRDGRRLEIVVDGLPLFGGAQFAVDSTLVSALHCDGSATAGNEGQRRGGTRSSSTTQGEDLSRTGQSSSTGSVGRAGGVRSLGGGQRRHELSSGLLARARTRNETTLMRRRAEQAWRMRWWESSLVRLLERLRRHCWVCAPPKVQTE